MSSEKEKEKGQHLKAWVWSLLIHGAIILFFVLFKMVVPDPPMFAGGSDGVEVNFGTSEDGMGDVQPSPAMDEEIATATPPKPEPVAEQQEEKIVTQDLEETPAVVEKKIEPVKKVEKKIVPPTPVVKKEVKPVPVETKPVEKVIEKPVEPAKPVVNSAAIYKGKKNQNPSTGNEGTTGKPGDQGVKEGSLYSKNHGKGGGTGDGSGNGPGGSGGGLGDGNGPGTGSGVTFNLDGRKMLAIPKVNDNSQETGKVVVSITVDKTGKVINAVPGARGSTTTATGLYAKAKQAAMKAQFDVNPNAAEEQKGTITFIFIVQ